MEMIFDEKFILMTMSTLKIFGYDTGDEIVWPGLFCYLACFFKPHPCSSDKHPKV